MAALIRRRDLALPLLTAPLLAAQTALKRTPEQELEAAREQLRKSREQLTKLQVSMDKEPAFAFRVY